MKAGKLISIHNVKKEERLKSVYFMAAPLLIFVPLFVYSIIIDAQLSAIIFFGIVVSIFTFGVYLEKNKLGLNDLKSVSLFDNGIEWVNDYRKTSEFITFDEIADVYIIYNTERNYKHKPKKLVVYGSALNIVTKDGREEFIYERVDNFITIFEFLKEKEYPNLDHNWIDERIRIKLS